jgi:hypothetical protein
MYIVVDNRNWTRVSNHRDFGVATEAALRYASANDLRVGDVVVVHRVSRLTSNHEMRTRF